VEREGRLQRRLADQERVRAPVSRRRAKPSPPAASVILSPQDLYVYISEHEHFTDFNASSALFWQKRDLVYGDWTSGENADGCYEHYGEVDISQVGATGAAAAPRRGLSRGWGLPGWCSEPSQELQASPLSPLPTSPSLRRVGGTLWGGLGSVAATLRLEAIVRGFGFALSRTAAELCSVAGCLLVLCSRPGPMLGVGAGRRGTAETPAV